MSNINQEIIFPGSGLNSDDEEKFIDLGSSPYRLNILVSEDNAIGILTNMKGNSRTVDINDHLLTKSNTYVTVGSYYNRLTRKCYYFVFSQPYDATSSGDYIYDNKLFCYNEDSFNLDLIFTDTKNWFGLDVKYPMRDCTMIGDWLYFNPRISEPKMIDVVRAFNYTNYPAYDSTKTYIYGDNVTYKGGLFMATGNVSAGQTPSTNITKWTRIGDSYKEDTDLAFNYEFEYAFNVIKMPPYERPKLVYGSDTNVNSNNVRGKIFRFSYRYKYFDNSYSVYSAYSDVSLPEYDELYNGEYLGAVYKNNYIEITTYLHSPALVKEIEIVFQETGSFWKRAKIINRQSQDVIDLFTTSFKFYNNESYPQVDEIQVARIADFVPKEANSQEIINKNILAYGGCLEGFNNLNKDDLRVVLEPTLETIVIPPLPGATVKDVNTVTYKVKVYDTSTTPATIGIRLDIGSWYLDGLADGQQLIVTIDGKTVSHFFTAGEVSTSKANFILVVTNFIRDNFPAYNVNNSSGANYVTLWSPKGSVSFANITQFLFCTVGATNTSFTKKRGFKTGANHPFCIFYYDENLRRWDAQVSKDNTILTFPTVEGTTVYVPMFTEFPHPIVEDTGYRWIINWEVYHLPPAGAKYWRWGYAGNSLCDKMVQYIVSDITTVGAMAKVDITPLQTLRTTATATWNQYPNSSIDPYAWQAGDRIRFITAKVVPAPGTTLGEPVYEVYDYEIIKQDDTDNSVYTQYFDYTTANLGQNTLVEIYTPLKRNEDTKIVYHEFGDLMPIIEDSAGVLVHAGQNGLHNQDTLLSHAALGTFDSGDIYHIMRTPSKPLDTVSTTKAVFHESMWYSDFYDSTDYDRGKIGIETTFGERFLNIIRYSRPYFQNTQINGLPTFEEDPVNNWAGFKELNDIYGDIIAIYEQGDTLKVYQARKASSILIGRTEYYDTQGNNAVSVSTVVLGAIRYSPSNYSTIFPESIARNNKFIYGFDIYNGVVWRDSVNGLFPISGRYAESGADVDYKMQTYFKLKAKALMQSGVDHVDVVGVWDEEFKNFFLTFKDYVLADNDETIVWHEPSNRWITFASFDQTPQGGFNVPLELSYSVVRGFDAGIGFSFDEETRFAVFTINTPKNYNPALDVAGLSVVAYDPTVTVDCATTADLSALTITPYDPTVTVTLPLTVTIDGIDTIPSGAHGTTLYAFVNYTNAGDAGTENIDYRFRDASLAVISSGTIPETFLGETSSTFTLTLTYPSPAGNYSIQVKRSATPTWTGAKTMGFTST